MYRTSYLFLVAAVAVSGAQAQPAAGTMSAARKTALIKSALAAAPKHIAANAAVIAPGPDGKMITLREGTNGFTCVPDDDFHSGAMCADAEGMKWAESWMSHAEKPANTAPGLIYMLAGGTEVSDTDPWAKPGKGKGFPVGPHYMVMWPFETASGLPTAAKQTGTWIMWSGTPYAHLMVNGKP